jgi:hypothetical protein
VGSDPELLWAGAACAKCGAFIPLVEAPPAPPGLDTRKFFAEGTMPFPAKCDACGHEDTYAPATWSMRMVRRIVRRNDVP